VLSWIEGHVPWAGIDDPPGIYDDGSATAVARLARAFHDLTAVSPLADRGEVVCHNDLSPKNTVYQQVRVDDADGVTWRPIAFIDWDAAAPGLRIHDVAHISWQWAANTASSPATAARRIRVIADAYGLDIEGRGNLVDTILWWQDRCWRGIQAQIDEGNQAVRRLVEADAVGAVRADFEWTLHHRKALDAAVA
jgi:thiamine kinase-like enzyme